MIKFEHTVTPSPEQMEFIIEGMRNPMDSWEKSDSYACVMRGDGFEDIPMLRLGDNDADLMTRLKNAGTEHRKFMRMMPVMVRITAPLYWWKEFDTYKIGTVRNSCSTMHTLHKKGVTSDAFSHEWVDEVAKDLPWVIKDYKLYLDDIEVLRGMFNETHDKKYWYAMIQMLPDGFMMTANVSMSYENVYNMRKQRGHHKQDEWRETFMKWTDTLPYQFLFEEKETTAPKMTNAERYYKGYTQSGMSIDDLAKEITIQPCLYGPCDSVNDCDKSGSECINCVKDWLLKEE